MIFPVDTDDVSACLGNGLSLFFLLLIKLNLSFFLLFTTLNNFGWGFVVICDPSLVASAFSSLEKIVDSLGFDNVCYQFTLYVKWGYVKRKMVHVKRKIVYVKRKTGYVKWVT